MKRGLFGGAFSTGSLVGSVALHLAALLIVVLFAGGREGAHRGVVGVDISQLGARPRAEAPKTDKPRSEVKKAETAATPEAGAVPIPEGDAAESTPAASASAEQDAAADGAEEALGPILPPQTTQGDGSPDPTTYQLFIETMYRRFDEATQRSWRYAAAMAQMGIIGGEYHFHVLIGLDGQTAEVQFIPEKTSVLFNSSIDSQTADRHIRRFFDLVTADVRAGVPYPEAPARVPLKPFCYSIRAPFPGAKM